MSDDQATTLRKAIENLISAKLYDLMGRPGGLDRLIAHRMTGVASHDVRNAEQQLERTLAELVSESAAAESGQADTVEPNRPSRRRPLHATAGV
jgi:hypothetical protein